MPFVFEERSEQNEKNGSLSKILLGLFTSNDMANTLKNCHFSPKGSAMRFMQILTNKHPIK